MSTGFASRFSIDIVCAGAGRTIERCVGAVETAVGFCVFFESDVASRVGMRRAGAVLGAGARNRDSARAEKQQRKYRGRHRCTARSRNDVQLPRPKEESTRKVTQA
jgi:hypothetical protein